MEIGLLQEWVWLGGVVDFKTIVRIWDLGLRGSALRGVFLRDHNPYLREFRRKPRKTLNC